MSPRPATLQALFATETDPPAELAALVLARDFDVSVDIDAALNTLDALASPLARRLAQASTPREQAAALGTWLCDEQDFRGNEAHYYDPRNSDLAAVLASRRGIPITLSVVMMAVGRRAGLHVEGVGFPGHFLVRIGGDRGVLVDPFFHGRIVTASVLAELAQRTLGGADKVRREHLTAASSRAIAARMLQNLKGVHEARGDHALALVACDRLVDLTGAPEHRRDRAGHLLALGASAAAAEDLQGYLAARPDAPDAPGVRLALEHTLATRPRALQ